MGGVPDRRCPPEELAGQFIRRFAAVHRHRAQITLDVLRPMLLVSMFTGEISDSLAKRRRIVDLQRPKSVVVLAQQVGIEPGHHLPHRLVDSSGGGIEGNDQVSRPSPHANEYLE